MILWGYIFVMNHVTNMLLYWLPTVNLLGFALAVYVDRDMKDLVDQAEGIEKLKYNYQEL